METLFVIASNVLVAMATYWLLVNWPDITPFALRATWRIKADVVEDPESNTAYIHLADRESDHLAATTIPVTEWIEIDLDPDGRLIGIDLNKNHLPPKPGAAPSTDVPLRREVLRDYDLEADACGCTDHAWCDTHGQPPEA